MERFLEIINKGIEQGATDIHLQEGSLPLYNAKVILSPFLDVTGPYAN